jgi:hypothetical protein
MWQIGGRSGQAWSDTAGMSLRCVGNWWLAPGRLIVWKFSAEMQRDGGY